MAFILPYVLVSFLFRGYYNNNFFSLLLPFHSLIFVPPVVFVLLLCMFSFNSTLMAYYILLQMTYNTHFDFFCLLMLFVSIKTWRCYFVYIRIYIWTFFLFYFFSSLHLVDVFSFAVALFAFCLYPSCWWCLCEWVSVCVCAYDEHWSTEYIWLLWRKDSSALMLINSRWIWGGFLLLLLLLLRFLRFVVLRCARGLFVVIFCYSRFSTW